MKKSHLIIGGSILLVAGGITTWFFFKKKKNQSKSNSDTESDTVIEQKQKSENTSSGVDKKSNKVIPQFDNLGNLINPYSEIKGQTLYAQQEGTNLRESAEVDNSFPDNKIKSYGKDEEIGKIISSTTDDLKKRWFKVKLNKSVKGVFSDTSEGWLRQDNVTFKPFTPEKSNVSGISARSSKRLRENVPDLHIPIERYKPATTGLQVADSPNCEIDRGLEVLEDF